MAASEMGIMTAAALLNRIEDARLFAQVVIETVREPLVVLDGELNIQLASGSFHRYFDLTSRQTQDAGLFALDDGAWDIPTDQLAAHTQGATRAVEAGYALLSKGAPALDAVEAAVTVLEDDEAFDAGRGSFLTRDGRVQLDALLMDGATLRAGGVACVERLKNPGRAQQQLGRVVAAVLVGGDLPAQALYLGGLQCVQRPGLGRHQQPQRRIQCAGLPAEPGGGE